MLKHVAKPAAGSWLLLPKRSCKGSIETSFFFFFHRLFFFFSDFWRTTQQNLRMPSSSCFQGLKFKPFSRRSFFPFDPILKIDVGAPPYREGVKPLFDWITQPFFNRFKRMIHQNDGQAAPYLSRYILTCCMSTQLCTGGSKRLRTGLLTVTRPFLHRFQRAICRNDRLAMLVVLICHTLEFVEKWLRYGRKSA
jgi:hypothetical protein